MTAVDADVDDVRQARRTVEMERLTSALAEALTVRDVATAIADHILPICAADGMVLSVMKKGVLHLESVAGYSREFREFWRDREKRPPAEHEWPRIQRTPEFVESLDEFLERHPNMGSVAITGGKHAWAFLPMVYGKEYVGLLVISFRNSRTFEDSEKSLMLVMGGLAAQALARTRMYDAEHERAEELQRALLPGILPDLPALTVAARYRPAGGHSAVGGDWYDAIPLSAGRVVLIIGDVMGHGLSEAVIMGRLRTAVATLAGTDYPPGELLARLNDATARMGIDTLATCLCAVYDPTTGQCTIASAGHPPPIVALPGGTPEYVEVIPGPPLGTDSPFSESVSITLPEGSLLMLYTDGILGEAACRDPKAGMTRLRETLAAALDASDVNKGKAHLEELCENVTANLAPTDSGPQDDAAVMAVRSHRTPDDDTVSRDLPAEPAAAGLARRHVHHALTHWGAGDDVAAISELIVSELISNAVRYARGPIRLRLIRGAVLTIELSDGSEATPRIRHPTLMEEGGRGLFLVAEMSDRWGARYVHDGKIIWVEVPL